jgi:hypothetical protein
LAKNKPAYYRALENMFNFTEKNKQMFEILQRTNVVATNQYEYNLKADSKI